MSNLRSRAQGRASTTPWKVALASSVLCLGCSDDNEDAVAGELAVATYNLGLIDSVAFAEQRTPLAIEAAAGLDADVLCVQEVWEQADWDALAAAQEDARPHTLRLPAEPGAVGQCLAVDFDPLQSCAEAACADSATLVSCVTTNCGQEVAALESGCTSCLLENAGSGDFAAIRSACVGAGGEGASGRSYVQGGSYGIGLFSNEPFAATAELRLDASTVRRAILYARLDESPLGTVHLFCTHLSAIQPGIRYEGSYGSWEGENAAHVAALIAFVNEKAGADAQVIVMGDLNTGPAGEGISPSVPESYAQLPPADFGNAFLSGPDAACTFCSDNALVVSEDAAGGAAIDHILTKNVELESVSVERIFTEPVQIELPAVGGQPATTRSVPLSDHYGLRAVVGP